MCDLLGRVTCAIETDAASKRLTEEGDVRGAQQIFERLRGRPSGSPGPLPLLLATPAAATATSLAPVCYRAAPEVPRVAAQGSAMALPGCTGTRSSRTRRISRASSRAFHHTYLRHSALSSSISYPIISCKHVV